MSSLRQLSDKRIYIYYIYISDKTRRGVTDISAKLFESYALSIDIHGQIKCKITKKSIKSIKFIQLMNNFSVCLVAS